MARFSVIIPTYNRARYLKEALESVFRESHADYEVIVVDDGSTDETRKVLEPFQNRIQYIHQQNQGRSAARNAGLRIANGELIAFLDSDDRWFPDKLDRQDRYMRDHPDTPFCHGHVDVIGEEGEDLPKATSYMQKLWSRARKKGDTYENWALECRCLLSTVVIRADCLREAGGFDASIAANEELDLYLRLAARHPIGFLHGSPLSYYRMHRENTGSLNLSKGAVRVAGKHLEFLKSIPCGSIDRKLAERNFHLALSRAYFILGDGKNGKIHYLKAVWKSPAAMLMGSYVYPFATSFLPSGIKEMLKSIRPGFLAGGLEKAVRR